MNDTQAIFTVFFAIVWGTSANAWPRRRPFNWAFSYDDRIWNRAWLSVSMLNVVPVSFFIGCGCSKIHLVVSEDRDRGILSAAERWPRLSFVTHTWLPDVMALEQAQLL